MLAYFEFFWCQSGFLGRGLRTDAMFALTFAQQSLLSCGLRPYLARRPNCAKDCRGAESWQWLRLPLLRLYCAKFILFTSGFQSSSHYHDRHPDRHSLRRNETEHHILRFARVELELVSVDMLTKESVPCADGDFLICFPVKAKTR